VDQDLAGQPEWRAAEHDEDELDLLGEHDDEDENEESEGDEDEE
jgi:hypothetical protein